MKKNIVLLLAILFLFTNNVYAVTNDENYCASQLKTIGVLKGYEDGSLRLERPIRRSEVATIAVRILNPNKDNIKGEIKSFSDLATDNWAYNIVSDAYNLGIIHGYPDGSFKPNKDISLAEVITIMVNCTGDGNPLEGQWPDNYMAKAKEMKIIPANDNRKSDKIVSRGEMAQIVWNSIIFQKK